MHNLLYNVSNYSSRCQASRGVSGVGVGVGMSHLSESTRERLAAASQHHPHAQQPLCTDPIGAQHLRQRRTSAREPSIYGQVSGIQSDRLLA